MAVVLDASATLAWLFDDERDDGAIAMAEAILRDGAIVPALWRLELRNALLAAERRGRLTAKEVAEILADVRTLPIEAAQALSRSSSESELELARTHRLSVYDAAHLELAVRLGVPLMSRDASLNAAAADLGLRWQPPKRRTSRRSRRRTVSS
ncbi:MAG TPA: type II toxin-antitoxin system VapC family toxin [Candidatus Tumulicola sp.]|nr:type II toxin-antitoxin system VapC family toxin [Candidatus Tumulicola sp.]